MVVEEEPDPSPMSSLPSTPESLAPLSSTNNDSTQQVSSPELQRLSPRDRRVRGPACPGSTCPVTPQTTSSGNDEGDNRDSNKENVRLSNFTDDDDPYCTANLHLLWRLTEQAIQR
jgi:hypothetical protein